MADKAAPTSGDGRAEKIVELHGDLEDQDRNLTEKREIDQSGPAEPDVPPPAIDEVYKAAAEVVIAFVPQFIHFKETTIKRMEALDKNMQTILERLPEPTGPAPP